MYVILQYGNAKVAPIQKKDYRNWKMQEGKLLIINIVYLFLKNDCRNLIL